MRIGILFYLKRNIFKHKNKHIVFTGNKNYTGYDYLYLILILILIGNKI
jgi:hypothetical protein